ncbi:hypothetical protein K2V58_12380 [Staphylococcus arlettae]|uniref:hypothetical protein n=1 Tax=Staphylococcus arlettae TaxID=29378 RepID=UPI001E369F83|nr:hypothetical protein [Staphylococcus arlettae]MCD8835065.1 hypothetical protein [Staphylococcus arlettae]
MRIKIVNYNKLEQSSFDEQINKVIEELEDGNLFSNIIDIKVMNEKRVMILYKDID